VQSRKEGAAGGTGTLEQRRRTKVYGGRERGEGAAKYTRWVRLNLQDTPKKHQGCDEQEQRGRAADYFRTNTNTDGFT